MTLIPSGMWRHAKAYEAILVRGRPGLAWELLRRDLAYGADVALRHSASQVPTSDPQCLSRWGLHFRM
jgi:hypothetical protein